MPNPGDFDPAEAVQGIRQQQAAEEAAKQRAQAQEAQRDLYRANILKLLRYADEQLEDIRNPVVSEFIVTEWWWTEKWWTSRLKGHHRQTRYYGSWLSLSNTRGDSSSTYDNTITGLVKLRQLRAGYAKVKITDNWDPRNASNIILVANNIYSWQALQIRPDKGRGGAFQVLTSLEEVTEDKNLGGVETLTKCVTQALDFVATGQPPEPQRIEHDSQW